MRSTAGFPGWLRHMALDHMPARRWRPVLQIVAPRESRRAEVLHTATRGCLGNSLVFHCQLASSRPTPTPVPPESQWRGYSPPQEPPAPAPGTCGVNRRPCPVCWLRRLRRPSWELWCGSSPAIPRTAWQRRWRASGGPSLGATWRIDRTARDAEKHCCAGPHSKRGEATGAGNARADLPCQR